MNKQYANVFAMSDDQNRKKWFSRLKKDPIHTLFPKHKEDRDAKANQKINQTRP